MAAISQALVVGGGVGGLSAAIGLRQAGIDVDLIEISENHGVYHVGIIVQANFLAAMGKLGAADAAIAAGFPYDHVVNLNPAGGHIFTQPPIATGTGYPLNLGITRPALHRILVGRARELGVPIRLGVTVVDIAEEADGVTVAFSDGSSGRYDLVIGADGIRSAMRDKVFGAAHHPRFTGQGVWRYNVRRPADLADMQIYRGKPGMTVGLVPLDRDTMYVFVASAEPGNPRFAVETRADELRRRLEGYGGHVPEVRAQVTDPALVVYRPMESMVMPAPWHRGRVVLIGDAVHPSTPHLGQGAAMAIEDAVVLVDELGRHDSTDAALAAFMQRRFERVRTVVEASGSIGEYEMNPGMKLDIPGLIRNVFAMLAEPA
ncbi:MAG: FAD-dependent monooxygenase [Mesorhizobium sp.]|nr:FAD-dependent monooxygenase [Mesorhizobium sp.]